MNRIPELTKKEILSDDRRDLGRVHLARVPDGVEHADCRRERVGDLLCGCRARLLKVVAAHVYGVPLRDVAHRVGDHVDDQPPARLRREDVGAPRQVLLHDVVLRRARSRDGSVPVFSA